LTGADGLRVGPDRLRGVGAGNSFIHGEGSRLKAQGSLLETSHLSLEGCSCRLGYLAGPHAPRADADPLHAAADDRPNRLQVRLEPPRAHVVSVADLTAHHRALPAHFALFRHG